MKNQKTRGGKKREKIEIKTTKQQKKPLLGGRGGRGGGFLPPKTV